MKIGLNAEEALEGIKRLQKWANQNGLIFKNFGFEKSVNSSMIKPINKTSVKLCCGGACPEVRILASGNIELLDDFGHKAFFNIDEALLISEAVKQLLENKEKDE